MWRPLRGSCGRPRSRRHQHLLRLETWQVRKALWARPCVKVVTGHSSVSCSKGRWNAVQPRIATGAYLAGGGSGADGDALVSSLRPRGHREVY